MNLPAPFVLTIPGELAVTIARYEAEGIPGTYDIPVPDEGGWRMIARYVDDGDEILLVSVVNRVPVVQVPAIVLALHQEGPSIEVLA